MSVPCGRITRALAGPADVQPSSGLCYSRPMTDDITSRQRAQRAAARAGIAAIRARVAVPVDRPAVFVTRDERLFRWEIRRYGAIVLLLGTERFLTPAEARGAGEAALSAMMMQRTESASV